MKATEFCDFFEFSIARISKEEYKDIKKNDNHWYNFHWADENEDNIYEVSDMQGVFEPRYINKVADLTECFDSMLNDYIDEDVEENGFTNDENNTEKSYYEQMLDWLPTSEIYKNSTGLIELVACLVNPWMIEDDTKEVN